MFMSVENLSGRVFGPYRLENVLGLGAMGAVYRAHQQALERDVAVKVLPAALAARPDYLARFNREAKIAASLEHPHIVPLYDYGTDGGMSYVVMRMLNGGTLAERLNARALANGEVPSLSETSQLLRQVAGALDYAHRKGVIHRDIKPNNIMFDDEGTSYVVDFGIAKLMNVPSTLTAEQSVFGTPHYMSPEQWRDKTLTPESDQYALAVVIYSMVTGQPPFDAPTPHALMYKHFHETPAPASSLHKTLPPGVDAVLERALSKTPEERFDTVGDFSRAFDAAIANVPARSTDFFTFPLPQHDPHAAPPPLAVSQPVPVAHDDPPAPPKPPERGGTPTVVSDPIGQAQRHASTEPALPSVAASSPRSSPVLPPPPVAAYPAPSSRGVTSSGTARPARRETNVSPLLAGVGLGTVLLAIVVCGGGALLASQLGLFDQSRVDTQPSTLPVTEAPVILTAIGATPADDADPLPTNLPMPGDTPMPEIGPLPPPPPGTAIAVADARNLAEAASMSHGTLPVRGVGFRADGQLIATGAADGGIYLWDRTGTARGQRATGGGIIYDLDYSADGRWLATAHEDGTVRLWDAANVSEMAVLSGHGGPVRSLAFSPDGQMLASASEDQTVRIWDVTAQAQMRTLEGLGLRALAVGFSADGARVAGAGEDGVVRIWDVSSGATVTTLSGGGPLRAVAFSPTQHQLATAGVDGRLRIWNADTGELLVTSTGHSGEIWAVTYSPNGALLASGGRDNTARVWDAASGDELTVLRGHSGWVLSVAFSTDGSQLVTGGGDGTARLWDVAAG